MKLTTRQDVEAPVTFVFDALADFGTWERMAMRRGADVIRMGAQKGAAPGTTWQVRFPFRGKARDVEIRLDRAERPQALAFSGGGKVLAGMLEVTLAEMGATRTRVTVAVEVKPLTLGARVMLGSLRLMRGKLAARLDKRVAWAAADIAGRYKRSL